MTRKAAHRASLRSVSGREPSRSGLAAPPKPERPRRSLEWLARSMLRKQQPHAPALAAASDRCGEAVAAARRARKCFDDSFQSQSICLARLEAVQRRWRCGSSDCRPGARRARRVGRRSASSRSSRTPATSTGRTRTRRATTCSRAAASRIPSTSSWPRGSAPGCSGLGTLRPSRSDETSLLGPLRARLPRPRPDPSGCINTRSCGALGRLLQDGVKVLDAAAARPGRHDGSEHGGFAAPRAGGRGAA